MRHDAEAAPPRLEALRIVHAHAAAPAAGGLADNAPRDAKPHAAPSSHAVSKGARVSGVPDPMRLQFLGAADTVTGSRFLLQDGGRSVLVDCGLFQGYKVLRERNWAKLPVAPRKIDAVALTHAHLDHSGWLPVLVREGFRGASSVRPRRRTCFVSCCPTAPRFRKRTPSAPTGAAIRSMRPPCRSMAGSTPSARSSGSSRSSRTSRSRPRPASRRRSPAPATSWAPRRCASALGRLDPVQRGSRPAERRTHARARTAGGRGLVRPRVHLWRPPSSDVRSARPAGADDR